MDIADWLAEKADVILTANTIGEAKERLTNEIIEPRNPYELLSDLTGQKIGPPKGVGIYLEGGQVVPLPQSAILFER